VVSPVFQETDAQLVDVPAWGAYTASTHRRTCGATGRNARWRKAQYRTRGITVTVIMHCGSSHS